MAETDFYDLATVGLKDFNPMWLFPSTSACQNWEHITFGMEASPLKENPGNEKDALVCQSPIGLQSVNGASVSGYSWKSDRSSKL